METIDKEATHAKQLLEEGEIGPLLITKAIFASSTQCAPPPILNYFAFSPGDSSEIASLGHHFVRISACPLPCVYVLISTTHVSRHSQCTAEFTISFLQVDRISNLAELRVKTECALVAAARSGRVFFERHTADARCNIQSVV